MPDAADRWRRRRAPALRLPMPLALLACLALGACEALQPRPTPSEPPAPTATATATASPSPEETSPPSPTESASPSPTPEPPLSLDPPDALDLREVSFTVEPQVSGATGQILVSVTNLSDTRITEILLRWPSELNLSLRLAPFVASLDRTREGGAPLSQDWSRWVLGPGESGEPEGTMTLGYGPLDPDAMLAIPLFVIGRDQPGPVSFDLQVLAGQWGEAGSILVTTDGEPAEARVDVP
jgi:hypothetical protein